MRCSFHLLGLLHDLGDGLLKGLSLKLHPKRVQYIGLLDKDGEQQPQIVMLLGRGTRRLKSQPWSQPSSEMHSSSHRLCLCTNFRPLLPSSHQWPFLSLASSERREQVALLNPPSPTNLATAALGCTTVSSYKGFYHTQTSAQR